MVDVPHWAADHFDDFRRVCAAVVAAAAVDPAAPDTAADSSGGGDGLVRTALLTAMGVAFTLLTQFAERWTTRRRRLADELAQARSDYAKSARTFLSDWAADPEADFSAVSKARERLAASLSELPGGGPRGTAGFRLAERLPLARRPEATEDSATAGVRTLSRARRTDIAEALRTEVSDALAEVQQLRGSTGTWWYLTTAGRAVTARLRPVPGRGGATP
ncbi:hypothetical protein [Streptomyces sp. NBC_01477]|uniref:hypothetical protein n=1 Tax=Streptomyces sp. NBC_01477 TaxID=2976015 RepID=UPI002E317C65|nr:hypothetical protein [Streptomyces sp. NBC_01477]